MVKKLGKLFLSNTSFFFYLQRKQRLSSMNPTILFSTPMVWWIIQLVQRRCSLVRN